MRSSPTLVALLAAVLLVGVSGSAAAQDMASPVAQEARRAFEEGRDHHNDRRYLLAAEAFERAYDLMHQAGLPNAAIILFNLGTSLDEIPGRERDARDAYARYLEEARPTDEASTERIALVQDRIRELDLRISAAAAGAPQPTSEGAISPVGPIVLGAGGAALIASAIVAGVLAADNDAFLAMCDEGVCPSSARASAEAVRDLAIATDVLWITGAVVAATGLVLTLLLREGGGEQTPVTAGCGRDGCTLELRGAF